MVKVLCPVVFCNLFCPNCFQKLEAEFYSLDMEDVINIHIFPKPNNLKTSKNGANFTKANTNIGIRERSDAWLITFHSHSSSKIPKKSQKLFVHNLKHTLPKHLVHFSHLWELFPGVQKSFPHWGNYIEFSGHHWLSPGEFCTHYALSGARNAGH